ncbi:MAG: SDR family oxidoreductase [Pirellulales bacterium]|nr:SDR family oxidoreductase [Pirellulales bacterium]
MPSPLRKSLLGLGSLAAGYAAYRAAVSCHRRYNFLGRVVVITGGSRGLGLVLARQLADEGARIAICARDQRELIRAARELEARGVDVLAYPCDLADADQLADFLATVRYELGPIDVLINNAGVIQVGPLETQTDRDFQEALSLHLWAPLRAMEHVLPEMRCRRDGRIVNISSIGGKIAVPHLVPYTASKFALAGLSQGYRAELARYGVYVTTVCPGLMRTGSPRHAWFKGRHREEYAWFSISDAAPFISMSAEAAARKIISACRFGRAAVTLSLPAKLAAAMNALAPELTADLAALAALALPPPGGVGSASIEGTASFSSWSPSLLTLLNERAAVANNQILPESL